MVAQHIDYVSMDIKIPSATGERSMWGEHQRFLEICKEYGIPTFAKAVVGFDTTDDEIVSAASVIRDGWSDVELILQPVTPFGAVERSPSVQQLLAWEQIAREIVQTVRVIPQTHKMMGAL